MSSVLVLLTARSSQDRGQEGPQLLKAVPGTSEHGETGKQIEFVSKRDSRWTKSTWTQPSKYWCSWSHTLTGTVISVTSNNFRSQTFTVIPLPLWNGIVTFSSAARDAPTTWLGALSPVTPLTPSTITWRDSSGFDCKLPIVISMDHARGASGMFWTYGCRGWGCRLGHDGEDQDREDHCLNSGDWHRTGTETECPTHRKESTDPMESTPTTDPRLHRVSDFVMTSKRTEK